MIHLMLVLIAVGVLLWLTNTYIPMDGKIKNILNVVVVIAVVLYVLRFFGLLDSFSLNEKYHGALALSQKLFG